MWWCGDVSRAPARIPGTPNHGCAAAERGEPLLGTTQCYPHSDGGHLKGRTKSLAWGFVAKPRRLAGVRRVWRTGRRWPAPRTVAFFGLGLLRR
jgi:hypothetical protein